ncbi:hypothetical protein [Thiomicrorhabdus xiamenensis]|uniref:Uncharacterized protein n=1 Tax=Thiomicrorhabdus xiamenensis TaxID=2739063 RepID=A0A7D4SXR4_9GAMM|nr:hypothetical protein [Thiomicrorhabdus xiamenensis]QKI88504.1 hypothetical protein HQN79_02405 [Thiomicrorhabdus xiamenensis]
MKISQHAYEVVKGFKNSLTDEQLQVIQEENFEELQILVEAAIGSTASRVLHDVAKEMEALAKKTRHSAASIEKVEN